MNLKQIGWQAALVLVLPQFAHASSQGEEQPIVVVNEAMSHTDSPYVDAFELHNTTDRKIKLKGWMVTDKKKLENAEEDEIYVFGSKDRIPANGYITVRLGYPFVEAFGLKAAGDEISLFDPDGNLVDQMKLKTVMHNRSYGYYINSVGERDLVPLEDLTMDAHLKRNIESGPNSGPYIGPFVISKFKTGVHGYIEIKNVTSDDLDLCHPDNGCIKVTASNIDFTFPEGSQIRAKGKALLVASNDLKRDIKNRGNYDSDIAIYVYQGELQQYDELKIRGPEKFKPNCVLPGKTPPDDWEGPVRECTMSREEYRAAKSVAYYYKIDKVDFTNPEHWAPLMESGYPLDRVKNKIYGNDPKSWELESTQEGTPAAK